MDANFIFRWRKFKFRAINQSSYQRIASSLLTNLNSQVTRLYLVGIDGDYIANVIQHNTHLLEIQLSPFNRIGAKGAKWLAEAIKINSTLLTIDLSDSYIGDEGVEYLAQAIKINSALEKIKLARIKVKGAKWLAEAIKINSSLQMINLNGNSIGAEGAKEIAEAIKINCALEEINLSDNSIGIDGAKFVADAIKMNSTLQRIDVCDNMFEGNLVSQCECDEYLKVK